MAFEYHNQNIKPVSTSTVPSLRRVNQINGLPISYQDQRGITRHYSAIPETLHVRGNIDLLQSEQRNIAIVGTRSPDATALQLSYQLGIFVAELGAASISGLAIGVDTSVHTASVDNKAPTIAVLAKYPDQNIYPSSNTQLAERIVRNRGVIISENQNREVNSRSLVQRNRIIAALSNVVLLVSAGQNSGTAHTMRVAWSLGLPIGVLNPLKMNVNNEDYSLNIQLLSLIGTENQRGIFELETSPNLDYETNLINWSKIPQFN